MRWHDLLFMHWPVPPDALRPFIPPALALDTFDGIAWLGVVPFRMSGVHPRSVPALPWVSAFPELNLRTYVVLDGKPGVWFFSLDAGNPLAVAAARQSFHLPYYRARMRCVADGDAVEYRSVRTHRGFPSGAFTARYRPTGAVYHSQPGALDGWLTERYCLYAANRRGMIWRGDIHHAPWPLQPAEAEVAHNSLAAPLGMALWQPTPLLHFARQLEVVAWRPERVRG